MLNKKRIFVAFGFLANLTTCLFAGGWSSGGGKGIVCYYEYAKHLMPKRFDVPLSEAELSPDNIESIAQYDYYYAQQKEKSRAAVRDFYDVFDRSETQGLFKIIPTTPADDTKSYFHRVLGGVKTLIPRLGKIIENSHRSFDIIEKPNGIEPIDDFTDHLKENRTDRCALVQLARQRTLGDFHELDIDTRFFYHPKHPLESRVTVFLHEDTYLYGRSQLGQTSADATHILVAQFLNSDLNFNRLFRAARNFGITIQDTYPYIQSVVAIHTLRSKVDALQRVYAEKLGEIESALNIRNDSDTKNIYSRFVNIRLEMERVESKILAPSLAINFIENTVIPNHRGQNRQDLVREAEKDLKSAKEALPKMRGDFEAFSVIKAKFYETAENFMGDLMSVLKQARSNPPSLAGTVFSHPFDKESVIIQEEWEKFIDGSLADLKGFNLFSDFIKPVDMAKVYSEPRNTELTVSDIRDQHRARLREVEYAEQEIFEKGERFLNLAGAPKFLSSVAIGLLPK